MSRVRYPSPPVSPRRRHLLPWFALFAIYIVWGATYLAIRIVVREMPPFAAATLRFLVAGLIMGTIALRVHGRAAWPDRRQWVDYGIIGVLFLAVANGLVMWSETRVPSGIAALLVATTPLWLTLLDGFRSGGERWSVRGWLAVALGLSGVALVARPEGAVAPGHWAGIVALQFAAFTWSLGALYSQSVSRRLPVLSAASVEMIAGGAVLLVESRLAGEDLGRVVAASSDAWWGLAYLGIFGSLVGFTAFAYCLDHLPATTVGTYAYVNPVVAVLLGWMVLHEPLSSGLLTGGALIVVAVCLTTLKRSPRDGVAALAARFRAHTLSADEWTHVAHLTVGAWHVDRYGEVEGLERLRTGILSLNVVHGTLQTETRGYHETITRAYVVLIADFLGACPKASSLHDRVSWLVASPLAGQDALLTYYSRDLLMSLPARRGWVEPDRTALRFPPAIEGPATGGSIQS